MLDRPVIGVTGISASFAATVVTAAEVQERDRRAFAIRSVDMAGGCNLCDALIGLSYRGRSVETMAAMEGLKQAGRLAITNDPDSPRWHRWRACICGRPMARTPRPRPPAIPRR